MVPATTSGLTTLHIFATFNASMACYCQPISQKSSLPGECVTFSLGIQRQSTLVNIAAASDVLTYALSGMEPVADRRARMSAVPAAVK